MSNPWAFGWNQIFAIVGLLVTVGVAIGGFRSFHRWKREKIEDFRIEIAFDALALAYESRSVFRFIRNANGYEAEWESMPKRPGESDDDRSARGVFFAILKRLQNRAEFFQRAYALQPRVAAVLGPQHDSLFENLFGARNAVEFAAQEMTWRIPPTPIERSEEDFQRRMRYRGIVWEDFADDDEVEPKLDEFRREVETCCRPIVRRRFEKT